MEGTLGKRIMQHRKSLGLTQDQLAERLGVTAQAVSKWENDQSCPDISMLPKLAALFGTTTDALLGHEPVYEGQVVDQAPRYEPEEEPQLEEKEKANWEFHWDGSRLGAMGFAIYVLTVGGLLFAARYFGWDTGFWSIAWPTAFLVGGLLGLTKHFNFTNIISALLGGYFLINNLGIYDLSLDKGLIFPALILIFGFSLLVDALRKPKGKHFHIRKNGDISRKTKQEFHQEANRFSCSISFGDATHKITSSRLQEGEVSVSFGELTLDLTGCEAIADNCQLDVSVSFGELSLLVPRCYRIECDNTTSFGDISTHGHADSDARGVIHLDGSVSFGELEIHYV